jgi:hypothetical protein
MARSKKKRKISLKKRKAKNYKATLNTLTARNKNIISEIATRNRNRMRELELKLNFQIRNENLSKKSIPEKSEMRPDDNLKKKIFL